MSNSQSSLSGLAAHTSSDAPDSIDPFKYIASDSAQVFKSSYSTTAIGSNYNVRCLLSAEPIAAPAVPTALTTAPTTNSEHVPTPPAKARPAPKVAFPDDHLPELLRLIEGNTAIRTDLISELRKRFDSIASKAAIEAKVKEVAVREGKKADSPWRVREDAWVS